VCVCVYTNHVWHNCAMTHTQARLCVSQCVGQCVSQCMIQCVSQCVSQCWVSVWVLCVGTLARISRIMCLVRFSSDLKTCFRSYKLTNTEVSAIQTSSLPNTIDTKITPLLGPPPTETVAMTHVYVWHGLCLRVAWLIVFACGMAHSVCVWYGSFAEYRLFYRALLQKRPMILMIHVYFWHNFAFTCGMAHTLTNTQDWLIHWLTHYYDSPIGLTHSLTHWLTHNRSLTHKTHTLTHTYSITHTWDWLTHWLTHYYDSHTDWLTTMTHTWDVLTDSHTIDHSHIGLTHSLTHRTDSHTDSHTTMTHT